MVNVKVIKVIFFYETVLCAFIFLNSASTCVFPLVFLFISKQIKKSTDAYHIMEVAGFTQVVWEKSSVRLDVVFRR